MASQLTTGADLKLHKVAKFVGITAAYASFCCSASPWIVWALFYVFHFSWLNHLTGFDIFKITGVGLLLSVISAACRTRISFVAVPVAAVMFFFTMYVMGS
jgi:hypothetical protein